MGTPDRFITVAEAATLLHVSVRKMYQLLSLGAFDRVYPPHTKRPRLLLSAVAGHIASEAARTNHGQG